MQHARNSRGVAGRTVRGCRRAWPRIAFMVPGVPAGPESSPISLIDSEGHALELTGRSEHTHVEGPLAETELRLTFHNPDARIREGTLSRRLAARARS